MVDELKVCSPTGSHSVRGSDPYGAGYFGAPRGSRTHAGVDYNVEAGQDVYAPITGKIIRKSYPYRNDLRFSGVVIEGVGALSHIKIKLWYFNPIEAKVGKRILKGEKIGVAQDLTTKYPTIENHLHMNLYVNGKLVNSVGYLQEPASCSFAK